LIILVHLRKKTALFWCEIGVAVLTISVLLLTLNGHGPEMMGEDD
jgi:hypothetical protein